jgi:hypothetical protein
MSMRYRRYTNLKGHQVEFASELVHIPQLQHYQREAKSQKAQLESRHGGHGASKGRKRPMKDKLT